jgi:hypothetical protein
MRPHKEFRAALELIASGLNDCQVGRAMGIPRPTIRDWRMGKRSEVSSSLGFVLDMRYPGIIEECRLAIARIRGQDRLPGLVQKPGCVGAYSGWKHWPCLFPQHGRGPKHRADPVDPMAGIDSRRPPGPTTGGPCSLGWLQSAESGQWQTLSSVSVHEQLLRHPRDIRLGLRHVRGAMATDELANHLSGTRA